MTRSGHAFLTATLPLPRRPARSRLACRLRTIDYDVNSALGARTSWLSHLFDWFVESASDDLARGVDRLAIAPFRKRIWSHCLNSGARPFRTGRNLNIIVPLLHGPRLITASRARLLPTAGAV